MCQCKQDISLKCPLDEKARGHTHTHALFVYMSNLAWTWSNVNLQLSCTALNAAWMEGNIVARDKSSLSGHCVCKVIVVSKQW